MVSPVVPAACCCLLALAACNPPDVAVPRIRNTIPPLGGAGTPVPGAGAAGSTMAGVGGSLPPGGTGAPGGTGGMGGTMVAGTGGGSTAGVGSSGGVGGGIPQRMFNAGTDPNRNAVMAGTICARLATIQCAGEAFCCDNPGRDVPACEQEVSSSCTDDALVDDIAADPASAFDAAQALTVFTELERRASECDPSIAAFGESYDGLRSIFKGTVGPGGDCRPDNPLNMKMAGAALAACTDYRTQACVPSLSSWTCTPHAGAGGHCFSDINCQPGLFCDNPNFSVSGSDCMQRKAVGSPCDLDNECQTLFCRGGVCVAADVQAAYCLALAP